MCETCDTALRAIDASISVLIVARQTVSDRMEQPGHGDDWAEPEPPTPALGGPCEHPTDLWGRVGSGLFCNGCAASSPDGVTWTDG